MLGYSRGSTIISTLAFCFLSVIVLWHGANENTILDEIARENLVSTHSSEDMEISAGHIGSRNGNLLRGEPLFCPQIVNAEGQVVIECGLIEGKPPLFER